MPPTAKQRSDTQQFMQLTGASERIASRYLKAAGWKSDVAIDSYYSQGGSTGAPTKDTTAALTKIFEQYRNAEEDEKDTTGVNGTMSYLEAIGVDIESVDVLVPLEIVQAPVIGEMTKQGFVDGWKALGLDTVAKQKDHVTKLVKQLPNDPALFKRVYRYTWVCARESGAKALAVDAAIVYWEMLFSPGGQPWVTATTNWLELWIEYLRAKWNKSVNKDMWNMTLEFANKSMKDETLSFWDENGAWPGVIDDFVVYAKQKRGSPETMEID